ncbi:MULTISPECIES: TIGR02265 family protein [Corallococcus]|uniref:TIGR02265 family protein n=1 Tax=Corallococcus TaxID=83461 RepID=UPI00117D2CC9|nr:MULTISPECIES: TIGR02265 family protein [Corallococcus]NBD09746.1 TIGR02265 family protein [Corallococcus silvisoli]TSC24022.1 TIGR02265 family protein [Corallococcus sp. Z5C101001]
MDRGPVVGSTRVAGGADESAAWHLRERCLAATPEDGARGMFFQGVVGVVGFLQGEAAGARCLEASGLENLNAAELYPVTRFLAMASEATRLLRPQLGDWAQSLRYIGTQATVDFLASMFGRELMQAARRNPRLLLQHLADGYRTAVSYGDRSVLWTGDHSARFVMRRDFMPAPYHEGVLVGALEAVGATDIQVHGRQLSLLDTEYDVSW